MRRTDRELARRLERTEAHGNASFVMAHARLDPAIGCEWRDVSGTWAMFDGVGSPITQTFGLGLFADVTEADLEVLEAFFGMRGAETHHEVCPLSDPAHLVLLPARGYRPIELSSVLWRPLEGLPEAAPPPGLGVRPIEPGEETLWAKTSAAGWSSEPAVADLVQGLAEVSVRSEAVCFLAEHEGAAVATGGMFLHGGVVLLAGASTVPAWRGRGAQNALLHARLRYGAERGADLAMVVALPGSTSQLNAERQGFRMAYTRTKWAKQGG